MTLVFSIGMIDVSFMACGCQPIFCQGGSTHGDTPIAGWLVQTILNGFDAAEWWAVSGLSIQ